MSATTKDIASIFAESRNGCNGYIRHPLARSLIYTDGVQEVANAGAYWLLDVIGTEAVPALLKDFKANENTMGIITMVVADSKAEISMATQNRAAPVWKRNVPFTDFPEGTWKLYLCVDQVIESGQTRAVLILPSEY